MKALLFSGQGAQKVGMGKSLYENSAIARELYDRANAVLPFDLKQICFEGPQETLTETRVCQPALFTQGYVIAQILKEQGKLADLRCVLGLSIGELTAYAVAGVWDFETGLKVVAERGRLMQEACDKTKGGMAAIIGGSREDVLAFCKEFDVDAANFNTPGQIVISGDADKIAAACAKNAETKQFKRAIPLVVAGAYHSRLMEPARAEFADFLASVEFKKPEIPVFTNTTGTLIDDPAAMREALAKQVVSSVLWEDCVRGAAELGVTETIECGPGGILTGMVKKIAPALGGTAVSEFSEIPA